MTILKMEAAGEKARSDRPAARAGSSREASAMASTRPVRGSSSTVAA